MTRHHVTRHHDMTRHHDVLVVGAGPSGLATALAATRSGARVLVVERRAGPSDHPRAIGVTTRSVEILRAWGLEAAVRTGVIDVSTHMTTTRTLADPAHRPSSIGYPTTAEAHAVSPVAPVACPQDRLEPLLLEQLRVLGGEVRFDTALSTLRTTPEGVVAELTDRATGAVRRVRARYVVGADGPRSTVRAALGIASEHLGTLGDWVQVLFRADLEHLAGARPYFLYAIEHPEATGVLLPVGGGRWAYARPVLAGVPGSDEGWAELIRTATGARDLRPRIHSALPFTMAADVATTFRAGPGFLVGDAAHRMTPMGGAGMNTGIHDAHNLGWKLAWAARGLAGDALLDSYTDERRPIGLFNALSSVHPGEMTPPGGLASDLGTAYRSAVIDDDGRAPTSGFAPSGRPGERAPHRWVTPATSTVEVFEGRFTLVTGRDGQAWRAAARRRSAEPSPAVPDLGDAVADAMGIGIRGAALVRPDGHVSWRCTTAVADEDAALEQALDTTLGRAPVAAMAV